MGLLWEAVAVKTPSTVPGLQDLPTCSRLPGTRELSDVKGMEDMNISGTPVYYWDSGHCPTKVGATSSSL